RGRSGPPRPPSAPSACGPGKKLRRMRPNPLMPTRMPLASPPPPFPGGPRLRSESNEAGSDPGQVLEPPQAAVHRRLAHRGIRACRELAPGVRRGPQPEGRGFAERVGGPLEPAFGTQSTGGLELELRGAARADEVRVIGVREAVRARARIRDDRALLEGEDRLRGADEREERLDRIPALRVRRCVVRPFDDAERDL